jgi:NADH-quinone oxidoreductase subunit N
LNLAQQLPQLLRHAAALTPEVFLTAAFLVVVTVDLVREKQREPNGSLYPLTLGLVVVAGWLVWREEGRGFLFGRMLLLDGQAVFFKLLVTLAAAAALAHAWVVRYRFAGELHSLLLAMLLGLYLLTMAVNLLTIYLAVELVSLVSYVLTALHRDRRGAEGAVKYALFGAVSAAVMLYGMSLLYGLTGTLDVTDPGFTRALAQTDPFAGGVALVLTLGGLLFKIAAVPFHLWNPDVYEAAPTPVVSFFSVAPKAAAFLALMRLESVLPVDWAGWLAVVALASIAVGNFSALWQRDARRMLAYSSIAQSGFVLIGLAAASDFGLRSATFYLGAYLFTTMGAFLLLDLLVNPNFSSGKLSPPTTQLPPNYAFAHFVGLGLRQPALGVAVVLVMISLVGLPLTAGFSAKLFVFSALWETYQQTERTLLGALLLFGVFNAAVSLVFYLKLPFLLFFRNPPDAPAVPRPTLGQWLLLGALVLPIVVLFLRADWLMDFLGSL